VYGADNDLIIPVNSVRYQNQYYQESPWKKGQLQGINYYKYTSSGYVPKKNISYLYTDYRVSTVIAGTKIERIHPFVNLGCTNGQVTYDQYQGSTYASYFNYFDVPIEIGIRKPTTTYTTEYDDNGNPTITTAENVAYSSLSHLFPTSKTIAGSAGEIWKTDITYPRDYAGISVYDQMIAKNQVGIPIEQKSYKIKNSTTTYLEGSRTNYGFWNGTAWTSSPTNIIVPQTVETQKSGYGYETRNQYLAYDNQSHVKSVNSTNGPKTSYIYGYGGSYPIAQVINADYSTIESLLGGQINVDNFRNMLNPTDALVNSFLAPLRVTSNLPNAQINTYTYKPLVGMTSATDARSNTVYYEYDSFQRLVNIKDQFGNIKMHYCYNYTGQTTNCMTPGIIYAKLSLYSTSSGMVYGYNHTFRNYTVTLYSDAACTSTYVAPANLVVNYTDAMTTTGINGTNTYTYINQVTVLAGNYVANTGDIDVEGCLLDAGGTQAQAPAQSKSAQTAKSTASTASKTTSGGGTTNGLPGDGDPPVACTTSVIAITTGTGYTPVN
jgi:hypothetical protein